MKLGPRRMCKTELPLAWTAHCHAAVRYRTLCTSGLSSWQIVHVPQGGLGEVVGSTDNGMAEIWSELSSGAVRCASASRHTPVPAAVASSVVSRSQALCAAGRC
jgi:hypothetical protein